MKYGIMGGLLVLCAGAWVFAGNEMPGDKITTFVDPSGNATAGPCTWNWLKVSHPAKDEDTDNPVSGGASDDYAHTEAQGCMFVGYAWAITEGQTTIVDEVRTDTYPTNPSATISSMSNGSVRVWRSAAAANHLPQIRCDWKPSYRLRAEVNPIPSKGLLQGSATASGQQIGECTVLTVDFNLSGSVTATHSNNPPELPKNLYKMDVKPIDWEEASYSCNVSMSASCSVQALPPVGQNGVVAEAFAWECRVGLDLYGSCQHCAADSVALYDWYE